MDEIDEELDEIEQAKAKGIRDAVRIIDAALKEWDVHYGVRVEIVEFYGGEDKLTVKHRMISEQGMEG